LAGSDVFYSWVHTFFCFEMHLWYILKWLKISNKKFIYMYIFTCYVRTKYFLHENQQVVWVVSKRQNLVLKIRIFMRHIFLHRPQIISVFRETTRTHIDCQDIHAKYFVGIFWQIEIFIFLGEGSICPRETNWISPIASAFGHRRTTMTFSLPCPWDSGPQIQQVDRDSHN
jgi:hypothetical protein